MELEENEMEFFPSLCKDSPSVFIPPKNRCNPAFVSDANRTNYLSVFLILPFFLEHHKYQKIDTSYYRGSES